MSENLVGTVWRDSNWHAFTVTHVQVGDPTERDDDRNITLVGVTTNCTPFVCPWSHEGKETEVIGSADEIAHGRIFGWTRQDVWEADPYRSAQPQVTDEQRRLGLEAWARIDAMPSPVPDPSAVEARQRQAFMDAGLLPPDQA